MVRALCSGNGQAACCHSYLMCQSRLLNLNAFYNPGATPAPTPTQPVAQPAQAAPVTGIDPNLLQAITQNPLAMALLKTALQAQLPQQQG